MMNNNTQNVYLLNRDRGLQSDSCSNCMRNSQCPSIEMGSSQLESTAYSKVLHKTVKPQMAVCSSGDKFDSIYVVRSGFFKSYFIDTAGIMQVTNFHFPGDVFGIDGIESGVYQDTVEALDTGSVCKISLSTLLQTTNSSNTARADNAPHVYEESTSGANQLQSLVRIMSRTISRDRKLIFALGKMCALRRLTTFLLEISQRMEHSGYQQDEFRLCMSRTDISNYLCLALETVSRLFTQLQSMKIIAVERRDLKILDMPGLQRLIDDDHGRTTAFEKTG